MDQGHRSEPRFHILDDHGQTHEVVVSTAGKSKTMKTTDGHDVLAVEGGNYWIEQLKLFAHRLD